MTGIEKVKKYLALYKAGLLTEKQKKHLIELMHMQKYNQPIK